MITVTLVCDCCNTGMNHATRLVEELRNLGHTTSLGSRNMHGRLPRDLGLPVDTTTEQLRKEPYLTATFADGYVFVCLAQDYMKIVEYTNAQK